METKGIVEEKNQDVSSSEKLYDLSMVISVSGGDQDFIKKMVALFIETVPQNVAELKKFAEAENWEQVAKTAHKLKSTIDSMGIKLLHQDIRTIEGYAKQGDNLNDISSLINKVSNVIENCVVQLKQEFQ